MLKIFTQDSELKAIIADSYAVQAPTTLATDPVADAELAAIIADSHIIQTPAALTTTDFPQLLAAPVADVVTDPIRFTPTTAPNMSESIEFEAQEWPTRLNGTKDIKVFTRWFQKAKLGAPQHTVNMKAYVVTICITATTLETSASGLIALLSHMHRHNKTSRYDWPSFELPEGVLLCHVPKSFAAFLWSNRTYIL